MYYVTYTHSETIHTTCTTKSKRQIMKSKSSDNDDQMWRKKERNNKNGSRNDSNRFSSFPTETILQLIRYPFAYKTKFNQTTQFSEQSNRNQVIFNNMLNELLVTLCCWHSSKKDRRPPKYSTDFHFENVTAYINELTQLYYSYLNGLKLILTRITRQSLYK